MLSETLPKDKAALPKDKTASFSASNKAGET
jgi:hypothetical protein